MTRITTGFLLVLLMVLGRSANAQQGTVSGTVVARQTGMAVQGASISVDGATTTATANGLGAFRLAGLSGGTTTITVRAPGFLAMRVPDVRVGSDRPLVIALETSPSFLEQVQVTATKTATAVGDVAAAPTTIVDRDTIDRRGDQRLTEAIEHVPGAVVTTELGIFESVLLRGMPRVGNEFTNTLLLVDGVPQTNAGNDARVVALPIYDASSVEVVRGPNSALYGRTAIGGAVNILTADPTATPELKVDLTGGQFGTAKGVVTTSGPLGSWGGYYASVGKVRTGGYYKNLLDDHFTDGSTSLFGKLKFMPTSKSVGSVSLNRVTSYNSTPTNEPIINGQLLHTLDPAFERLTSFNLPGPNYYQGETRLTMNYTYQFASWGRVVETFGYRDVQRDFIEDGDFIGEPYNLAAQTVTMYPFNQQTEDHNAYQEARLELTGTAGPVRQQLIVGASYERNAGTSAYDGLLTDEDTFGFADFSYVHPVIPDRRLWMHDQSEVGFHVGITGIFGQYIAEPLRRLVITAGGRYDRLALDATRDSSAAVADTVSAFSPKAGATVRLLGAREGEGAEVNAFAAYSTAFLPPRRPSALQASDTQLNLQPEDIRNYEGGLKTSMLKRRLALEASYFQMTEDGVVINRFVNNRFVPSNAGALKMKGFETGATYTAGRTTTAYANAAFYRHRYGDFVIQRTSGNTVLTGNRLVLSPSYVVNWGLSVTPKPAVNLLFDVKHVSATFGDESNEARIDAYTLVDAAATWTRGPFRVTASGRNLLNQAYYFDASSESADPGPSRQLLLSTTIRIR